MSKVKKLGTEKKKRNNNWDLSASLLAHLFGFLCTRQRFGVARVRKSWHSVLFTPRHFNSVWSHISLVGTREDIRPMATLARHFGSTDCRPQQLIVRFSCIGALKPCWDAFLPRAVHIKHSNPPRQNYEWDGARVMEWLTLVKRTEWQVVWTIDDEIFAECSGGLAVFYSTTREKKFTEFQVAPPAKPIEFIFKGKTLHLLECSWYREEPYIKFPFRLVVAIKRVETKAKSK
jgi:hypothetical protein